MSYNIHNCAELQENFQQDKKEEAEELKSIDDKS